MTNAIITIQTQYQENYADTDTSSWRNKGGQTFNVEINSDILMYGTDDLVPHINSMLEAESNDMGRYLYVSHDVAFSKVITLSQATLEASIRKEFADEEERESEELQSDKDVKNGVYGDC